MLLRPIQSLRSMSLGIESLKLMPRMAYVTQLMPLNITKAYVVQRISLMAYFIQSMPLNINNGTCHLVGLRFYVIRTCVIEPMSLTIVPLRSMSLRFVLLKAWCIISPRHMPLRPMSLNLC